MTPGTFWLTQEGSWRIRYKELAIQFQTLDLETITCDCVAELFVLLRHKIVATTSHNADFKVAVLSCTFPLELHSNFSPRPTKPSPRIQQDFPSVSHLSYYKLCYGHMTKKPMPSLCSMDPQSQLSWRPKSATIDFLFPRHRAIFLFVHTRRGQDQKLYRENRKRMNKNRDWLQSKRGSVKMRGKWWEEKQITRKKKRQERKAESESSLKALIHQRKSYG